MVSRGLVAAACAAALVQGGLLSKRHEARSQGAGRTRGAAAPAASREPATGPRRTAVCVAGAARTVAAADVSRALGRFVDGTPADLFFHLFVGAELSFRGQGGVAPASLLGALGAAAAVRLQHEENPIACGTDAAGRFFKIAKCAEMVRTYARLKNRSYDLLVVTRPDYLFGAATPLATLVRSAPRTPFLLNCRADFLMASYADGVEKAAGLADAACCDETRRSPRECFLVRPGDKPYVAIDGPSGQPCAANNGAMCDAPRSNFIMVRHMARNASVRRAPCPAARIRRDGDLVATRGTMWLHNRTRAGVRPVAAPRLTEPWLDWGALSPAARRGRLAAAGAARSDAPAGAARCAARPAATTPGQRLESGAACEARHWVGATPALAATLAKPLQRGQEHVAWDAAHVCAEEDSLGARDLGPATIDRNGHAYRGSWSSTGSKLQFSGCVADYGRGCRPWLARATPARCARPQERKEVVSIATVWGDSLWHWACESSVGLLAAPPSLGPAGTAHLHVTNASLTFETSEGAFVRAWLRRLGFGHLVEQGRVVGGCVRAERATMLPTGRCAAPSRRHLTWLSERLRQGAPPLEPRTALVVTRKDRGARNWAAVREVVARRFDVVIDHDDNVEGGLGPLDDQLAHFARAAVIVAPHGSGLFGLAATAPQACVVEFFPERYLNLCYAAVARRLDRTYRGLLIDAAGDAELAALPGVLDECVLRRRNATRGM